MMGSELCIYEASWTGVFGQTQIFYCNAPWRILEKLHIKFFLSLNKSYAVLSLSSYVKAKNEWVCMWKKKLNWNFCSLWQHTLEFRHKNCINFNASWKREGSLTRFFYRFVFMLYIYNIQEQKFREKLFFTSMKFSSVRSWNVYCI